MQHALDLGSHRCPENARPFYRSHRYRSFMVEDILTHHPSHKVSGPTRGLPRFEVQTLRVPQPYHHYFVLKVDRASVLSGSSGLQSGLRSHPMPLNHLRHKLDSVPDRDGEDKAKKGRRSRTVFTELQLVGLEKQFEKQKYLSTPDRIDLAESLGLSQLQVKTWYQNRRMKWKKMVLQGGGLESPTKPKGRPKKNSVPSSEQHLEGQRSREEDEQSDCSSSSHYNANLEEFN